MMNVTGEQNHVETTVNSFVGNLPELLAGMMRDPRILVAIADFEDFRYVQFWAEDDFIVAEVISNINVPENNALTEEQEQQLRDAGWSDPEPESGFPNWRRQESGAGAILSLALASADATTRILQQGSTPELQTVKLKTFVVTRGTAKRKHEAEAEADSQAEWDEKFAELLKGFDDEDFKGLI